MKALVLNGVVVQVEESEFEVAPPLTWVDCSEDVAVGYSYADGVFTAPEVFNKEAEA